MISYSIAAGLDMKQISRWAEPGGVRQIWNRHGHLVSAASGWPGGLGGTRCVTDAGNGAAIHAWHLGLRASR